MSSSRRTRWNTKITRWNKSPSSGKEPSLERRVFHRDHTIWYRENNNNDPTSPLTVERLPFSTKRRISQFLRGKSKKDTVSNQDGKERSGFETELPFFIDTTPTLDTFPRRKPVNLNESVILLESPKPSSATQTQKTDSVAVVDLCSESEDEQTIHQNKGKDKKKKTELAKIVEEPKNDSLDVIVLDDDEESVSIRGSKSSKQTNGKKRKSQPLPKEKTRKAKLKKPNAVHDNRSNCRRDDETVSNAKLSSTGTLSSDSNPFSLSSDVNSNKNTAIAPSSSSKFTFSASTNKLLPSCTSQMNQLDLSNNHLSENRTSNPRNALAQMDMRNSDFSTNVGSNVFNPNATVEQHGLRPIIIDGCNVAIAHGGDRRFSVRGLCICVEYFLRRGHTEVLALVPLHQRGKVSMQDRDILDSLQNDKHLVFTPSRYIENRLIASYDDRYIVQYAAAVGGVIVSKDNYRDLLGENPAWRDTILNRLLIPTWVGDILMFPVDPMGKSGPMLDDFLRFPRT